MRDHVCFHLNGRPQVVCGEAAFETLTEFLAPPGHAGHKVVCAEGDCGACTVLIGRPAGDALKYAPSIPASSSSINSTARTSSRSRDSSRNGDLHPVQQAMVDCHGSQCGYCTPGFVMALAGWTEGGCSADRRLALTGNLCRCTGYLPILDAAAVIAGSSDANRSAERYDTSGRSSKHWADSPRSRSKSATAGGRFLLRPSWPTRSRSRPHHPSACRDCRRHGTRRTPQQARRRPDRNTDPAPHSLASAEIDRRDDQRRHRGQRHLGTGRT